MHLNRKKETLCTHTKKYTLYSHGYETNENNRGFFLIPSASSFLLSFSFLCFFFVLLLKMCTSAEQLILQTNAEQGELTNWNKTKRNEVARGAERKEKKKQKNRFFNLHFLDVRLRLRQRTVRYGVFFGCCWVSKKEIGGFRTPMGLLPLLFVFFLTTPTNKSMSVFVFVAIN